MMLQEEEEAVAHGSVLYLPSTSLPVPRERNNVSGARSRMYTTCMRGVTEQHAMMTIPISAATARAHV